MYQKELEATCEDKALLQIFHLPEGTTRIHALSRIWQELGGQKSPVINADATFKGQSETRYQEGITKLAVLRSSSDFAFLYKHFSLKGALHDASKVKDAFHTTGTR